MTTKYKTAQPAPWPVGVRVRYLGDSISGFIDDDGETVWSHTKGIVYEVMDIYPPSGSDICRDPDDGSLYRQLYHGWSCLRSELDPEGKHEKAIDVESIHDFELVHPESEPSKRTHTRGVKRGNTT